MEDLVKKLLDKNNKIAYSAMKKLEKQSDTSNEVYTYINSFFKMLDSSNSYIRTRGIVLISKNAKWDNENVINNNINKYLEHIEDDKPIILRKCIQSLKNIIKYKPELISIIKKKLLEIDYLRYEESMQSLIIKDVDDVLKLMK